MHTISFYSFKGGVGRTLALVNVGVELAMTGRNVLLVDFDLEAPGIDTFEELRAPDGQPGLVDYVTDFMTTGTPADVLKYVYQSSLPEHAKGELRVMAAGRRDAEYGQKLAAIDWQYLYKQMEGYLFIEDLRNQWAEKLKPHYVLIDSRTGHTEVGGICTRQLPDTVVMFFMPNEQNLLGLKNVVESIRDEAHSPAPKEINIEFVMSNVPNLDDEEAILSRMMRRFNTELGFRTHQAIQRYDSLALLNQSVFVTHRPRSRLARQYRALLQHLAEHNIEDKAGTLRYLERQLRADYWESVGFQTEARKRVDSIVEYHAADSEVVFNAALFYKERGLLDQCNTWFEKAVELARQEGKQPGPRLLIERAATRVGAGRSEDAKADLLEVIGHEKVNAIEMRRAVELLRRIDEESVAAIEGAPALEGFDPDEISMIAMGLATSRRLQELGERILMAVKDREPMAAAKSHVWRNEAVLALIALGKFREAMALIGEERINCPQPDVTDVFNYAMALWGHTRDVPLDLLRKVADLDGADSHEASGANYEECLALCLGLIGRSEEARSRVSSARDRIREVPIPTFSCWSYMIVKPPIFEQHLNAIEALIEGREALPEFMYSQAEETGKNTLNA